MDTTYLYTLSADHVTANDNGDWRCEIENAFGKSSATCKVKVIDPKCDVVPSGEAPPRFLIALSNAMGPEDGTTELVCQTEGTEELKVKWFRNDNPIDDFSPDIERFVMTSEQGTHVLTIRRVKPRDAGVYKCKVSNDLGWTSCDAKFTVIKHAPVIPYSATDFPVAMELMERRREEAVMTTFEKDVDFLSHDMFDSVAIQTFLLKWRVDKDVPLHFPIHLKSRCAVEGSMTVMGCLVAGKPPYKVRWFKGATEIYESSKYYIDQRGPLLSLTIPRSEEDDTGNYTCTVRNCGSKVSSTCYLQIEPVLEITTEVPTKPLFVTKLRRQTVDEGQCITFQVQVTGNPRPGFKWFKDGLELHDSERVQTEVTRKGHAHLLIQNATFLDNGLYSCEAHNFAGRAQTMASVRVRDHFEQQLLHERQMTYSDENASLTDGVQNGNSSLTNGVSSPGYSLKQESQMFEHLPRFRIQLPREITVRGRERFLLEICAGGNPRPIVQWFKDGYQIYEGINYNFLSVGEWAGLEVINPLPRDAGRYMVKIVNDLGSVTSVCDVTMDLPLVEGKAIERQDLETTEELICQPGACVVLLQGEVDSSLSLAQIVPSSHLCNTEADWTTQIEKEVEVIDADEAPSFPHALPANISPHENDEHVHIECQVRGEPMPKTVWFKDELKLHEDDNIVTAMDHKTRIASLIIRRARIIDSGKYSCIAFNESGGHAATACDIQVLPVLNPESALFTATQKGLEFIMTLTNLTATLGSEVKLECVAGGFPVPKVKWYRDDFPIAPTVGKYTITSSAEGCHCLIIYGLEAADAASYKCEAVNERGSVECSAHVTVKDKAETDETSALVAGETVIEEDKAEQDSSSSLAVTDTSVAQVADTENITESMDINDMEVPEARPETFRHKSKSATPAPCPQKENATNGLFVSENVKKEEDPTVEATVATEVRGRPVSIGLVFDYKRLPKIVQQPLTQWLKAGETLKLQMEVVKSPDLKVTWFHNDTPIRLDGSERYKLVVKERK